MLDLSYDLTRDALGTRFALVSVRTFADVNDPEDVKQAHAAQDAIRVEGAGDGPFDAPDRDRDALAAGRKALNDLAILGFDASHAFGRKDEVRPVEPRKEILEGTWTLSEIEPWR